MPILIFLCLFLLAASAAFLYWSQKQFVDSQLQQLVERSSVPLAAKQKKVENNPVPVEKAVLKKEPQPETETQKSSTVRIIPLEIN